MKIIKPGETGFGVLIEGDAGYISSDLSYKGTTNSDLIKEQLLREFKSGTNIGKDGSLPDVVIVLAWNFFNEIKKLDQWLFYTKDFDYRVILDTGSTDGTYEALKKVPGIILH